MELVPQYYDSTETVITNLGNKVNRKCFVCGSQNIVLTGHSILKSDCVIRGDLANVRMGKYCLVSSGTIIRPPYKHFSKGLTFFPVHIGDHNCVIVGVSIGSYVHIGAGSTICQSSVIKDCCQILPNSVIMPDTVVAPFSIMSGNPARKIAELPPSTVQLMIDATTSYYENYLPKEQLTTTITSKK